MMNAERWIQHSARRVHPGRTIQWLSDNRRGGRWQFFRAFLGVPVPPSEGRPQFGSAKGMITMSDDFDAPLEDWTDLIR
jgi:Protein of unknown function (DUF2281)